MRLSRATLFKAGRMAAEGGALGSNILLKTEPEDHSKKCMDAFFD